MKRAMLLLVLLAGLSSAGCRGSHATTELDQAQTLAELRKIKGSVVVAVSSQRSRAPYPRERLVDGQSVRVEQGGLVWMRRDGGAVWLVSGPARFSVRSNSVELDEGRAFVDSEHSDPAVVQTPRGRLELSRARVSIEVTAKGVSAYVLRGSASVDGGARVTQGERVSLLGKGKIERRPEVSWEDWTGGLGTADAAAAAAPFGIGTVGARSPGAQGKPRFSLVIQRMDVNVTIDRDFALTEVDQTFVNPSSETVEGIFSFRTPPRAVLERFGVDRGGELVWGTAKESKAALRQYQSNVYEGSQEDPALLTWRAKGAYDARLYPIQPGAKRRVVTRYSEWLPRHGKRGERRLYVYPMAAEGSKSSLPRIEELSVTIDLSKAHAKSVRAGMGGEHLANKVVVKAFDFTPRADLALELFDDGQSYVRGYRAPHGMSPAETPEGVDEGFAEKVSREESDYVAIPLRAPAPEAEVRGVDLAIVVDTSAATEPSALAIARSLTNALLTHLGPADRAALWAGDAALKPVVEGSGKLSKVDAATRGRWLSGLASVQRGGATDIGSLLGEAAAALDTKRQGSIVYVGDGVPSVGELVPKTLAERVARLPKTTRVLVAAVGSQPNMALLESLARGAPAEQILDGYSAARASLRLLEAAGRPLWLGAELDLGPNIERILPKELPPISADETSVVVGRIKGVQPTKLVLRGSHGISEQRLSIRPLDDAGDLRRRWGQERLEELMQSGAGRASLVDLGLRFGLVSPLTALYVPTEREAEQEAEPEMTAAERRQRKLRWKPWAAGGLMFASKKSESLAYATASVEADDNREGGTGTRAKGEQGAMGDAPAPASNKRYAVQGPKDASHSAARRALEEAAAFGMMDKQKAGAAAPAAPEPPKEQAEEKAPPPEPDAAAAGNLWGDEVAEAEAGRGLGLSGRGQAGGGLGGGSLGKPGHGAHVTPEEPKAGWDPASPASAPPAGQGFGGGHGRLSAGRASRAPKIRVGAPTVQGGLPPEVIRRIVRQNFGRFRLCYERGLANNPKLAGRVSVRMVIGRDGATQNVISAGSDLPDAGVVGCIVRAFYGLSFPAPEEGSVTVTYPLLLSPADAAEPSAKPDAPTLGRIAAIGHVALPCGSGADLPLVERRVLWQERLLQGRSVEHCLRVYQYAVAHCEATSFSERAQLLVQVLNRLDEIRDQVSLWRSLLAISPRAADAVFRLMLLRVETSRDLRALHDALGFERIEPELLARLLKQADTPRERLALLRGAAERFPDDTELALRVLDAYEDTGDVAGGRAWARMLRRRVDGTMHLRTSVGEYYFRLAARGSGASAERDREEARRTFGEIVEFAPEDPLARRRLGDLLRAHGLYAEALRQYETLAQLIPEDPSVPLLMAAAAQGTGKTEEAVRRLEQAAGSAAPDGTSSVALAARALQSAYLAWARLASLAAKKQDELERLRARAARLASQLDARGTRVIVTWSHPELRTALWSDALGSLMPASENFPLFGVAQAFLPESGSNLIELRSDPQDAARAARLKLVARVTVVIDEGTPEERMLRRDVAFVGEDGQPRERVAFKLVDGQLQSQEIQ